MGYPYRLIQAVCDSDPPPHCNVDAIGSSEALKTCTCVLSHDERPAKKKSILNIAGE